MSQDVAFVPAATPDAAAGLHYRERSSAGRELHILMQDTSAQGSGSRQRFLFACFRDTVSRYLATAHVPGAQTFLRERVRAFEAISRGVDTRLDDFEGLGMFVALRERDALYLLCARGGTARLRAGGVVMPLSTPGIPGVSELPIETARSQHDLFAQTLPETLALYRVTTVMGESATRDLFLGGAPEDLAAAVDALEHSNGRAAERRVMDRMRHTVLVLALDAPALTARAPHAIAEPASTRAGGHRTAATVTAGVILLVAGVATFGYWRAAMNHSTVKSVDETALKETPPPELEKRIVSETRADTAAPPAAEEKHGFGFAWQQTLRAAVTSSPAVAGDAVIFGARDGKVYSISRGEGNRQWVYIAQGGVGASPVFRDGVVIAADYAGNVVALRAGSGAVIWKRALREKIVSTPAVTGERVAVGTVSGRVYALSLDTGRVLWKYATRGPVRGAIVEAGSLFLVPSHDGRLYALDESTGSRRWVLAVGGPVAASPASDGDMVVIGSSRGDVVAVDLERGTRRWTYRAGGAVNSALVVTGGRVYAGAGDRRLYCIEGKSGELAWRFDTDGVILSRPFVGDGRVMVTSYDGSVYCLDASSGKLIDRYETGESIFSSPVVVEGRVFFGNNAGRFYCLQSPQS